jgi:hypothetical protein
VSEPILFTSSIIKYDADGNKIVSSFLDEGETLASGITYEEVLHDGTVTPVSTDTLITPLQEGNPDADGGLTVDYTKISTVPKGSEQTLAPEDRTVVEEKEGDPIENGGVAETPAEDAPVEDAPAEDEKPGTGDSKQAWYDYAKTQGFEGEIDDLTKAQFIEQYNK